MLIKRARYLAISRSTPTVSEVNECAKLVRKIEPDIIIAIGGGSTIDLAKAVSICADDISVYHGTGKKVPEEHIPIIAVPTTSGTGSEVTCVSVLTDRIRGVKAPIVSESFYPKAAIIDPELTISVPPNVTASTGIDVLCHAVEGYWSKGHQPICDALADKIFELKKSLGLRTSLADLKLDSKQITELVRLSHHPNMDNNPVSITDDILTDMYNKLSR